MARRQVLESVDGLAVLVTGAAQGMGELFARRACADKAARVVLWDLNELLLEQAADALRAAFPQTAIETRVVDLADPAQIAEGAAQALAAGGIDILVNNAGVVTGKPFAQHSTGQIHSAMAVNALAPMYLTHALLPQLGVRRPGRILTIASAAALVSNPNMSVYAASKAAAASFSDSLRLELEREPGRNLAVTTFCPTYVDTGMFAGARRMLFTPMLQKQQVADRAWDAMLRATPMVLLPWTSKLGQALRGVLPRAAWDLLAEKVLGIYHSMDEFSGRAPVAGRPAQTPGNSAV